MAGCRLRQRQGKKRPAPDSGACAWFVAFGLTAEARRLYREADEFEDVRAVLLGVLAVDESVVNADTLRDGSRVRYFAACEQLLDFSAGQTGIRVAERSGDRLQLVLCEEGHLRSQFFTGITCEPKQF